MFKKILSIVLVLVLIGAGLGGMSSFAWLTGRNHSPPASQVKVDRVSVLSVIRNMSAGDLLKPDDISTVSIDRNDPAVRGTIVDEASARSDLVGAMLRHDLRPGAPIRNADILRTGDRGFLALALAPGMRAVTIGVDSITGTPGLIWPGDYVDLILTQGVSGNQSKGSISAETVLSNIRVIAIDKHLVHAEKASGEKGNGPIQSYGHTATLEVSPEDAERVYVGAGLGRLSLVVRAARGSDVVATPGPITAQDVTHMTTPERPHDSRTMKLYQGGTEKEVSY